MTLRLADTILYLPDCTRVAGSVISGRGRGPSLQHQTHPTVRVSARMTPLRRAVIVYLASIKIHASSWVRVGDIAAEYQL
jgi:hypothetical protein